ncbi:DUF2459 domain-containing protein, partial [Aquimarina litoralis]|nr:DUF2459 domain-containing protein [Aquimarina litoralis]
MRVLKWILYILSIPISYLIVSLIFTAITVDRDVKNGTPDTYIFLSTNGVHLDIILPKKSIYDSLLS